MRCVSRSAQDTARWGTVVGRLLEEGSVVVLQG
ncbi:tRNA (adenosine(37)-N6)-threonylcarbamoyltransferase complex ATPase subunit type 1 TsaE, partial [Treponema pallidum]